MGDFQFLVAGEGLTRIATRSAVLRLPSRSPWTHGYSNVHRTFSLSAAAFAGSSPLDNKWNQKTVAFATVIDSMVAGEGLEPSASGL